MQKDKLMVYKGGRLVATYIGRELIRRELDNLKVIAKGGYQLKYNGKNITFTGLNKALIN